MCVDFRKLNNIVDIRSHPIPLIDDILANLRGTTYFTTLDLRSGFHQIPLTKEASDRCAFSCFKGKYQYNVMPFGLNNAPNIFQRMVNELLLGCEKWSMAYIDDILIYTKSSIEDHMSHVQLILDRLRKHKLKLKLTKCQWLKTEIKYLGFIVNRYGVSPCEEKVRAIKSLRPPENVRQVRGLLGMTSYYRRFIPGFAKISEPLVELTKKYARFKWSQECQKAFTHLKHQLTVIPRLAYADINKKFILYCDSSDTTIGSVLVQETDGEQWIPGIPNEKPIYFLSHKLNSTQIKSYSTMEKELYAIHFSLNKLHFYLYNAQFIIRTDHQPLKYLFTAEQKNRRVQSWVMSINSYNCTIEYLKGTDNVTADLLSRSPTDEVELSEDNGETEMRDGAIEIAVINSNKINPSDFMVVEQESFHSEDTVVDIELPENLDVQVEQDKDAEIIDIKKKMATKPDDSTLFSKYMIKNKILFYISQIDDDPKLRVYVPSHLKDQVMKQYHDENGHMGLSKLFLTIKEKYYWPRMYKDLNDAIDACVICKERNLQQQKAPVQETGMAPYPMAVLQLDLSGPYRKTLSGNLYIATFICLYSGWIESFNMPDKSAQSVVECLIEYILPRHSCCLAIQTDNGTEFVNQYFTETLQRFNIKHVKTSTYSPRCNGAVERSHRCLHDILSKLMRDHNDTWDLYLNTALMAIRTNVSRTTQLTPFKILYNRDPVLPIDNLLLPRQKTNSESYHDLAFENIHKTFLQVMKNMKKAKIQRNEYANRKRKKGYFEVGDPVYLKNQRKTSKLDSRWLTHYIIVEQTGPVSFKVRHQLSGTISKVHADALRLARTDWQLPGQGQTSIRKTRLVESPPDSSTDSSDSEMEQSQNTDSISTENEMEQPLEQSGYDSDKTEIYDPNEWVSKGTKREKKMREDTESEDDIPPFELRRSSRVREKQQLKEDTAHP